MKEPKWIFLVALLMLLLTFKFAIADDSDEFLISFFSPMQNRITHDNVSFVKINVTSNSSLTFNCSVFVDGIYKNNSVDVPNATNFYLVPDILGLTDGTYNINVSCGNNMTLARTVRIDAVAPFYVSQCNDSVDLENETFYLANNIFESMPYDGSGSLWNYTKVNREGEDAMHDDMDYEVCIPITAFNSTFDGNGFNITGHDAGLGGASTFSVSVGISPHVNNVTIRNLNTSNCSIGILSCNSNHSIIRDNDVSRTGPVDNGVIDSAGVGVLAIFNNFLQVLNNTANEIQQSGSDFIYYSSCPFIYAWNGFSWVLQNEDLSPFHAYWVEGDYSARLPDLVPIGELLKIMIVENLEETTYFDSIALTKVTHSKGVEVYKDTDGNTYSVSDLKKPIKCVDSNTDCLEAISEEDGEFWNWKYDGDLKKADFVMEAELTFKKEGDFAKLLWNPKLNADPLDPLYVDLLDYVGTSNYDIFEKKTLENKQWEGHKDAINTLYLWNGKDWELLHIGIESMSVNHAGKWVVPVDLSGIKDDTFRIKIVTFPMAGGPDFVQVDFSEDDIISEEIILPTDVSCNNVDGKNLFEEDDNYVVMNKGDKCEVTFKEPKVVIGKIGEVSKNEVTYFTKSNGYYEPNFMNGIRLNEKNVVTKFVLETTFDLFWTHPDMKEFANFFPDLYMSHLTTNNQKHPVVPPLYAEDKPYHTATGYFIYGQSLDENLVANNTCYSSRIAGMETCVQTGLTSNLTVQNNWAKNMRTCYPLVYSSDNVVVDNTCLNFNASCVWAYSSSYNVIANNTCINGTSPSGCNIDAGGNLQFLGGACFLVIATMDNAYYNTFYNNFCNVSKFACVATLDEDSSIAPNFWNSSVFSTGRIDGTDFSGSGNFITNSAGDYYSDVCTDADYDGFCDLPFDVENDAESCASENCDYNPLARTSSCHCPGTYPCVFNCEDSCVIEGRNFPYGLTVNGVGDIDVGKGFNVSGDWVNSYTCNIFAPDGFEIIKG